jgi:hypothetical protein
VLVSVEHPSDPAQLEVKLLLKVAWLGQLGVQDVPRQEHHRRTHLKVCADRTTSGCR